MKCLFKMKKAELLNEAIKMRQTLIRIRDMDFDEFHPQYDNDYLFLSIQMKLVAGSCLDPLPFD